MRIKIAFLATSFLLLSFSASAQKVRTDYDHSADFSKYKTYQLVKIAVNPEISQLTEERITNALEQELAKKGFTKVDTGGDVLVGYQASVEKEREFTTFNSGVGPGWGWGGGVSTTTESSIPVGGLTVDMMDPAQKQLIFRATVTETLSDKPEKNAEKIQKSMQKIFDKYPPKADD